MRIAITTLVILVALAFVAAVYIGMGKPPKPAAPSGQQTAAATPASPPAATNPASAPAATTTGPAATQAMPTTVPGVPGLPAIPDLHVIDVLPPAEESTIGSDDPKGPYDLQVKLSAWGGAVEQISLAHYAQAIDQNSPRYVLQSPLPVTDPADGATHYIYPLAARSVTVNGQTFDLQTRRWKLISPGQYEVTLAQGDKTILRIERTYSVQKGPNAYQVLCEQKLENLGPADLSVIWEQSLFLDLPPDLGSYISDQRSFVSGYYNPSVDRQRKYILSESSSWVPLLSVLNSKEAHPTIWPPKGQPDLNLIWLAEVNRYFAAAVYLPVPPSVTQSPSPQTLPQISDLFDQFDLERIDANPPGPSVPGADYRAVLQGIRSKPITLAPGATGRLDLTLFAGPRDPSLYDKQPYQALNFSDLIKYQLGSCAFCTFQWLAQALMATLRAFHLVLRDWGLAIIFLVLVIRVILHPITRKSQINVTKMGKQMSTLQPEIEKLKKKYEDDQTKLNAEMMRLYKEKGVNPANALGCLPMFLQSPIWFALYAMLYYAIELRHQPAFFGVFQWVSGGHWRFLADLSSADDFIHFPHAIPVPFTTTHFIQGVNLLPILWAVFFFLQQAFMMPPAATEQAKQQQKIGKWATLIGPIFLYSAPSGLMLYMLASSVGGMVDSHVVRKHIKEQEENGTLFAKLPPTPRKPGGLMDRLQKFAEEKQRQMAQGPRNKNKR